MNWTKTLTLSALGIAIVITFLVFIIGISMFLASHVSGETAMNLLKVDRWSITIIQLLLVLQALLGLSFGFFLYKEPSFTNNIVTGLLLVFGLIALALLLPLLGLGSIIGGGSTGLLGITGLSSSSSYNYYGSYSYGSYGGMSSGGNVSNTIIGALSGLTGLIVIFFLALGIFLLLGLISATVLYLLTIFKNAGTTNP